MRITSYVSDEQRRRRAKRQAGGYNYFWVVPYIIYVKHMKENLVEELNFKEFNEENLVTKSNSLIEGRYKLTATEQKILLTLISKIEPDDINFKQYRFKIKDFEQFLGIKRNNLYKQMLQITKNIMKEVVGILDENSNEIYFTHWVQTATYKLGSGYAEFTFDPELKPLLLQLKNKFVSYQLLNVIKLKSFYSIRIYELLKQYEKIGSRTFEIKELKEILGIKPNEYKLYGDFKRKVLKRAEKEINEKTELRISFQEIKKGRKVVFIKFIIYQANEFKSLPLETTTKDELSERLQKYFCLSPVQTEKVLNTYEEKYIVENLAFIERKHKKGEIQNIGAYTIKALKEDYRNQKSQFDIQKEEKEKEKKQKQIKQQEKRKLVEKLKKQFDEQKQDKIKKIQQDLKNQGKLPLEIQEFEEIEIGEIFVERWEKEGLKNTMFQLMFDNFLAKRHLNPDESDFITWAEKQGHNIKKDLKGEYILITN